MRKTKLGEFEELVLLTVASLQKDAYGVEIKRTLEERMKTRLSVGSIQSALKRMEEKGFLTSEFGESSQHRGGKRKRIYSTTNYALDAMAKELTDSGVFCVPRYVVKPAFECRVLADLSDPSYNRADYPGTVRGLDRVLVLPWNEHYQPEHVEFIADRIKTAVESLRAAVFAGV